MTDQSNANDLIIVKAMLRHTTLVAHEAKKAHKRAIELAFNAGMRSEQVAAEENKALLRVIEEPA